jgi:hypothetical protein
LREAFDKTERNEMTYDLGAVDSARAFEIFKLHLEVGYALDGFAGVVREANEFCNISAHKLTDILGGVGNGELDGRHVLARAADSYSIVGSVSLKKLRVALKRSKQSAQEETPTSGLVTPATVDSLTKKIVAAIASGAARRAVKNPGRPTLAEMSTFSLRQGEKRIANRKR